MCLLGRPQAWRKNGEHLETEGWPSQVRHWWKVRGRGRPDPTYRQIFVARFLPEATQEQWRSFDELQRRSASPDNAWRIVDAISNIDVTDLAPKLTVPTLIMCSRREPDNRFEQSRSVMQNRLVSAGLLGLRERSVQVSGQQPQRVRCITRTFA